MFTLMARETGLASSARICDQRSEKSNTWSAPCHAAIAEEENVSIFALLVMQTTFGRRGRRARSQTDHLMPLQLPSWASAGSCRVVCTCPSHGTISDQLRASSVVSDEEGAQRLFLARETSLSLAAFSKLFCPTFGSSSVANKSVRRISRC